MGNFKQLTRTDMVNAGDLFVIYKTNAGDYRGIATQTLLDYLNANLTFPSGFATQYESPTASGFNIQIIDGDTSNTNTHLILTPTGAFAAGTLTLPVVGSADDKQEFLFNSTQAITALTVAGGLASVIGAPTTIAANDFFRLKYDGVTNVWYRVG